ncbi:hypothetical protein ACS8MQ_00875 [Pseudomonas sp. MAHUQ-62]|uniref:hypothetical protein n=1 Tax=Pseudomonas sp. GCM10023245 TaxID=3252652 RepID=UPI00361EB026
MQKRNSLSYETVKHLFDLGPDNRSDGSFFRVMGGDQPETILVPISVMYRLYRIGQAYGIRQLRYLEPSTRVIVGKAEIPSFSQDLKKVSELVNDEVLRHYVSELLAAIESAPGPTAKHVAIETPDYHRALTSKG